MYPLRRLLLVCIGSLFSRSIPMDGVCKTRFRCMPWDLDMFMEMNNGRVLTLYDLGRFDLSIRSGLVHLLRKKRWGLAVAGSSVRYRKRIRFWDRVTMKTRVVGFEGRWIYIVQSMWVKGEAKSSILLRTAVTGKKGRAINTQELLDAMGVSGWNPELPAWVKSWICSEDGRPWPPEV